MDDSGSDSELSWGSAIPALSALSAESPRVMKMQQAIDFNTEYKDWRQAREKAIRDLQSTQEHMMNALDAEIDSLSRTQEELTQLNEDLPDPEFIIAQIEVFRREYPHPRALQPDLIELGILAEGDSLDLLEQRIAEKTNRLPESRRKENCSREPRKKKIEPRKVVCSPSDTIRAERELEHLSQLQHNLAKIIARNIKLLAGQLAEAKRTLGESP
jgi:hypothetical protein